MLRDYSLLYKFLRLEMIAYCTICYILRLQSLTDLLLLTYILLPGIHCKSLNLLLFYEWFTNLLLFYEWFTMCYIFINNYFMCHILINNLFSIKNENEEFLLCHLHSSMDIYMYVDYIYYLVSLWLSQFSINLQHLLNHLIENIQTYTVITFNRTWSDPAILFCFIKWDFTRQNRYCQFCMRALRIIKEFLH